MVRNKVWLLKGGNMKTVEDLRKQYPNSEICCDDEGIPREIVINGKSFRINAEKCGEFEIRI